MQALEENEPITAEKLFAKTNEILKEEFPGDFMEEEMFIETLVVFENFGLIAYDPESCEIMLTDCGEAVMDLIIKEKKESHIEEVIRDISFN